MAHFASPQPTVFNAVRRYWRDLAGRRGALAATRRRGISLWEVVLDSMPSRMKSRFGDADYDWDFRVNTPSGALGWRDRLIGAFHSPYQPTEPALFYEMIDVIQEHADLSD